MDDLFQRILKVFGRLGLFEDGTALIGSWSFLLYQRHLGVRPLPLRTQDVDFLLPWPYRSDRTVDLAGELAALGFRAASNSSGTMYFIHPELKLEFLVPEHGKGGMPFRLVKQLGIRAIPLRFMDMLFEDGIRLKEQGVEVLVPKPLNLCLHKLIIAQRRRSAKREKDLEHAAYIMGILDPSEFSRALKSLPKKWRQLAEKGLAAAWERLPLERPVLDRFIQAAKN